MLRVGESVADIANWWRNHGDPSGLSRRWSLSGLFSPMQCQNIFIIYHLACQIRWTSSSYSLPWQCSNKFDIEHLAWRKRTFSLSHKTKESLLTLAWWENVWIYSNVFVKPNEQRPSLLGLCHGEKMSDELQPFHLFVYLLSYICHITLSYSLSANRKEDNADNYSVLTL